MGEVRHDDDGVVVEGEAPRRKRRGPPGPPHALTPVEKAELEARQAWRDRKTADRARRLALLAQLVPSLPTEGEPRAESPIITEIDGRTGRGDVRGAVTRANGSQVVAMKKHYDGAMGRPARDYMHLSVWYRCGGGEQFRTRGIALENPDEARAVMKACAQYIDEVERREGGE